LVDNAPQLANWKIVKFKQAHGPGFVTEYRGKSFDPDKIIFIPLFNKELPDSVGIQVCFPDYSEDEREIYINGTFIMLDALLGEKSTALDIDYLDVISTPNNISEFDFKHISELKNHIAEIKKEN